MALSHSSALSSARSTVQPSALSSANLGIDGLSVQIAGTRVLTNISFTVSTGQLAGLIGENGTGKSTLLHAIHGSLPTAATISGHVSTGAARVGLLHQAVPFSPKESVAEALESAVAAERRAARALEDAAVALAESDDAADRYSQALDLAERLDVWETDARISATLAGLGLGSIPTDRPIAELSGGQQARLSLAWLLVNRPDILLLDEPTNHLDDAAMSYLVGVLNTWRGPVLFASHDRAFLDLAASTLIDLDQAAAQVASEGGVTRYTGNYSDYLAAREDARVRWEQQYRDEQAELKRLRAGVRSSHHVGHADFAPRTESRIAQKFYADRNAKVVSRRVNDSRSRLEKLEESQVRKPPTPLTFAGLTVADAAGSGLTGAVMGTASGPAIVATQVAVKDRLASVSLSLGGREKLLITGPNGSGKSTLLSVLAERLEPDEGSVTVSGRVGFLTQEVVLADPYQRGPQRTVERTYRDLVGDELAEEVPLSTFGVLHPRDIHRPLTELSIGTQRRVALAVLLASPPEILLLDEPDNHFSLPLVTALEEAIPEYPGAVVVTSHDRWLREHWHGERLELSVG